MVSNRKISYLGLLPVLLLLAVFSCSREQAPAEHANLDGLQTTVPIEVAEFPALPEDAYVSPEDILTRRGSILSEQVLLGNQYYSADADATTDDVAETCTLVATDPDRCWAVYGFDNLVVADDPDLLTIELDGTLPLGYFIGWSDYATGTWVWTTVSTVTGSENIPLPLDVQPLSAGGAVYAIVALMDGEQAVISEARLNLDTDAPPPLDLAATDGAWGNTIKLNWTDPATSYPGLEYEGVRIERAGGARGPWVQVGEVAVGTIIYSDLHEGSGDGENNVPYNQPVYYRLRTVVAGVAGPAGLSDDGVRVLLDVHTATASWGDFQDYVEVTWEYDRVDADGYNLYYKEAEQDDTAWSLLTYVAGNGTKVFQHSATDPPGKGSVVNQEYNYRLKAAYVTDESIGFSSVVDGYRGLGDVQNLIATDGDYHDKVVISWDELQSSDGYNLYYKETAQGEGSWALLVNITGSTNISFDHTWEAPAGKECGYNVSYDYRAKGTFEEDESVAWSNTDAGFRFLYAPSDVSASDGAYTAKIVLTWSLADNATGYKVYRDTTDNLVADLGDVSSWEDLSPGDYQSHTYWVRSVTPLIESELSDPDDGSLDLGWQVNTIRVPGVYSQFPSSILLSNNVPAVFYNSNGNLTMVKGNSETPDSWAAHHIEPTNVSPWYNSAGLVDGKPAVCYYASPQGYLKFARATTSDPASTSDWVVMNIDENVVVYPGLFVINNIPAILYSDYENRDLKYAYASSSTPNGPEDWTTYTIESQGTVADMLSACVINGKPAAIYIRAQTDPDGTFYTHATIQHPDGPEDWNHHLVDDLHSITPNLFELDGKPAYSWEGQPGNSLQFSVATISVPTSSEDWNSMTVDGQNLRGRYSTSLIIDNLVACFYLDIDNFMIYCARAKVQVPQFGSDWHITEVYQSEGHSFMDSLVLTDNKPALFFNDEFAPGDPALWYAHPDNW